MATSGRTGGNGNTKDKIGIEALQYVKDHKSGESTVLVEL